MNLQGVFLRYGSNKSPLTQGFWRRFVLTEEGFREITDHFLPLHGIPQTFSPANPREASPTGKSGMGFVTHSIERQPVETSMRNLLMFDTQPIYSDARLITQSAVNPWDSVTGNVSERIGINSPGAKWTG